jgi:hypothetical protein
MLNDSNATSIVTLLPSVKSTQSTFVVSNNIAASGQRVAAATVTVYIAPVSSPVATISTSLLDVTKINNANKLVLLANVIPVEVPVVCTWSVDDASLVLQQVALTSVIQLVSSVTSGGPPAASPVNLVVGTNMLPYNAQYVFTLQCARESSTSASMNSILVTTNGSPSPGIFTVSPTSGTELTTTFVFSAMSWSDPDYPLSYQTGFISPVDSRFLALSSQLLVSTVSSTLPGGFAANQFAVTCQLNVFDVLDAVTAAYADVVVKHALLNASSLTQLLATRIDSAGMDTDSLKQAILSVAVFMNSGNCSNAPDCFMLNRSPCSSVVNTCGPCLITGAYVGSAGFSNDPCVLLTTAANSVVVSTCDVDSECKNAWYKCDPATHTCFSPPKNCTDHCNGHFFFMFLAMVR